MNGQITRVAVAAVVLLASLVVATTYWQTWASAGLADRQDNAIQRVAQFTVKRGDIYAADGRTLLARNVARKVKGKTLFFRRYPTRGLAAHVVGYSTQVRSRTGLERSQNDFLTAANANLNTVVTTFLDELKGATIKGNHLILTLRAGSQRIALDALGSRCGSVVALDPRTGRVLVMASSPTFDPNLVEGRFGEIERIRAACNPASPLLNRATRGLYPPGSIFKVLTASAALDSGEYTPDSRFVDPGYCMEYGKKVNNYDTTSPFGAVNLHQALQYSINSVFCEIGKKIGPAPIVDYAQRYGFYSRPPLETPTGERDASGLYRNGKLFKPKDSSEADPGRLAFGQERMLVSPLQMAMVAAGVANDGIVMRPYVVERVKAPDGSTVTRTKPDELGRAIEPETAAALTAMMQSAVADGTGGAAQLPGISVAGKTGTAETGASGRNVTWFISFAPADDPRVAVAVVVENQSSTGGVVAAPIARLVMQALLPAASNS